MTEETNSRPRLVFAVDLGGTHLRVALVDEAGKIHAQLKQESPKGERPDCVVTALVAAAESAAAGINSPVVSLPPRSLCRAQLTLIMRWWSRRRIFRLE